MSYALVFLAAVVAEVASLVIVGGRLGVLVTLGLVVAGFVVGLRLLTGRGIATVTTALGATTTGESVTPALVDGALLAIAGLLFVTPGFASDLVALGLLVPPVRGLARARIVGGLRTRLARVRMMTAPGRGPAADGIDVIDVVGIEVSTPSAAPAAADRRRLPN